MRNIPKSAQYSIVIVVALVLLCGLLACGWTVLTKAVLPSPRVEATPAMMTPTVPGARAAASTEPTVPAPVATSAPIPKATKIPPTPKPGKPAATPVTDGKGSVQPTAQQGYTYEVVRWTAIFYDNGKIYITQAEDEVKATSHEDVLKAVPANRIKDMPWLSGQLTNHTNLLDGGLTFVSLEPATRQELWGTDAPEPEPGVIEPTFFKLSDGSYISVMERIVRVDQHKRPIGCEWVFTTGSLWKRISEIYPQIQCYPDGYDG